MNVHNINTVHKIYRMYTTCLSKSKVLQVMWLASSRSKVQSLVCLLICGAP